MSIRILLTLVLATFLSACKADLKTIGTVDDDKLITPKTLADMGYIAFRKKYLGQEVTITNLYDGMITGAYKLKNLQCKVGFSTWDKESGKGFDIYIYTNHFPDFVLEDTFKDFDTFNIERTHYNQEINLPAEICDEWCEYDPKTKACFYKSPDLKITGKLFEIDGSEKGRTSFLYMKVKGVEY